MVSIISISDDYDGILVRIAHNENDTTYMSIDAYDCEYVADAVARGYPVARSNQTIHDLMLAGF